MPRRATRRLLSGSLAVCLVLAAFGLPAGPPPAPTAAANATVGTGTPGSCTPAALQQTLNFVQTTGGGNISFNCGPAPHTIVITATLQITTGVGFLGGAQGAITLSGGNVRPVFHVPLGGDLSLIDMVVAHGVIGDGAGGCIFSFQSVVFIQRTLIHSCRAGPPVLMGQTSPSVVDGSSAEGGAIYSANGTLILIDSQVLSSTADLGGGIRGTGYVEISGSRLAGNQGASFGGAVQAFGTLMIANSLIEHNSSNHGGGIWTSPGSQATVALTHLYSNTSQFEGGGIESRGALTLTQSQLTENVAGTHGGGVYVMTGTASLNQVVFARNLAAGFGGGLMAERPVTLAGTQFLTNTGQLGGGGAIVFAPASVTDGLFRNNQCTSGPCTGGGLYAEGATLTHTDFISNTAPGGGGGAFLAGPATVTGGRIERNRCTLTVCPGGGLYASQALTLTNVQVISNTSTTEGGGVRVGGAAVVTGGLFGGNQCSDPLCAGGGLAAGSTLTLTGTQFISNSTAGTGGALFMAAGRVVNALFARNTAGSGAALYLAGVGNTSLLHLTVAGPAGPGAAAIMVVNGNVGVTNTIIADHSVGISRTATTVYEDFNLFFGVAAPTAGGVSSGGHSFAGNPQFAGPAQDDYRLRANSNAINTGTNAGVFTDFEGDPRPHGPGFDIGFDEFVLRLLYLPFIRR